MTIGNDDGYECEQRPADVAGHDGEPHVGCSDRVDLTALLDSHRHGDDGDDAALERLLARLEPPLRRFLARRVRAMGRDLDFVQDAMQQSLVAIVLGLHGCRAQTDAELVAWALGVARNQLAELLRREGPWSDSLDDDQAPVVVGESFHTSAGQCDDVDPGLDVLLGVVGRISAALPAKAAALLWMRLIADYEWHEVGAELGISAGAAKLRFQRMQVSLRAHVREQLSELPEPERRSAQAWLTRQLGEVIDG
ncbi:MAG: hypothetical protein IPK33_17145 [Gemmatimonadetes bacterium]|nr:hypothetical protein [Gemmatimonadota bacterium]